MQSTRHTQTFFIHSHFTQQLENDSKNQSEPINWNEIEYRAKKKRKVLFILHSNWFEYNAECKTTKCSLNNLTEIRVACTWNHFFRIFHSLWFSVLLCAIKVARFEIQIGFFRFRPTKKKKKTNAEKIEEFDNWANAGKCIVLDCQNQHTKQQRNERQKKNFSNLVNFCRTRLRKRNSSTSSRFLFHVFSNCISATFFFILLSENCVLTSIALLPSQNKEHSFPNDV